MYKILVGIMTNVISIFGINYNASVTAYIYDECVSRMPIVGIIARFIASLIDTMTV